MTGDTITQIIILAFCTIMSAYFSATETAFSSFNKTRIKTMKEKGNKKAALVYTLSEQYDKLLSTILIGNNIVNIAGTSVATVLFVSLYGDIGATISTIVVTIVVLIFGEISPKSIAKDCPERFAMFSAPLLNVLMYILTPINFLFSAWKKMLSRLLKVEGDTKMSQEELLMLVDEVQQDGSIGENEGTLLRNAIEFNDLKAEDILTHRIDLEAVSIDASKEEVATVFSETKFSRLLVYEETLDNIVGIIHQKDFYVGTGISEKTIKELMTPPIFVPTSEKISSLLQSLQKNKSHIAVVIDEYGGTYGVVTMEDILEELVGEIWDEHDEITKKFQFLPSGRYRIDGTIDLSEFNEFFQLNIESEMSTLSGWITEKLDKIPEQGDHFTYEGYMIEITEISNHRILFIEVLPIIQKDIVLEEK